MHKTVHAPAAVDPTSVTLVRTTNDSRPQPMPTHGRTTPALLHTVTRLLPASDLFRLACRRSSPYQLPGMLSASARSLSPFFTDHQHGRIISPSAALLHPFLVCIHLLIDEYSCRLLKHDPDVERLPLARRGVVFAFTVVIMNRKAILPYLFAFSGVVLLLLAFSRMRHTILPEGSSSSSSIGPFWKKGDPYCKWVFSHYERWPLTSSAF